MQFFDLNIPYIENEKSCKNKPLQKQIRLKQIVKAMELGFCGIAYNRTIDGAMSESDRCTIPKFPLSSLLNVSLSLSSTVAFHRRLLGVPETVPFRQYTRLTVIVETSAQASALNSGNPVLKTYDLVAVRPLNQNSFDQACQSSQVDLISIDFGEKLPFRLKHPMVKAAIARGVYFEITYSSLMSDVQSRRQAISTAKLLVEWTRGKNLIVSSAAPSVLELRGPNDVANLSSLLGLSDERAKAAISKNCRSLIASALRKKQFHKEAIRVEVMPAGTQTDPKQPWMIDHLDWDPISSGEGDLLLDDMAKSFANSGKVSQSVKPIDFASIVNSVASHGLQVSDVGARIEGKSHACDSFMDFVSASEDFEAPTETEKLQKEPTSFHSSLLDQQGIDGEKSEHGMLQDSPNTFPPLEGLGMSSKNFLQLEKSDAFETKVSADGALETELQNCVVTHSEDMISSSIRENTSRDVRSTADLKEEVSISSEDLDCPVEEADFRQPDSGVLNETEAGVSTEMQLGDESNLSLSPGMSLSETIFQLKEDSVLDTNLTIHVDKKMYLDSFVGRNDSGGSCLGSTQLLGELGKEKEEGEDSQAKVRTDSKESVLAVQIVRELAKEQGQREDDQAKVRIDWEESVLADTMVHDESFPETNSSDDLLVAKPMLSEDMMGEARNQLEELDKRDYQSLGENKSGNHKAKRLAFGQGLRFPFKRLFQVQFKRNGRTSMYKTKKR